MTGHVSAMRVPGRGGERGTRGCLSQRDELQGRIHGPAHQLAERALVRATVGHQGEHVFVRLWGGSDGKGRNERGHSGSRAAEPNRPGIRCNGPCTGRKRTGRPDLDGLAGRRAEAVRRAARDDLRRAASARGGGGIRAGPAASLWGTSPEFAPQEPIPVRKTMILPILAISAIAAGCGGSAYGGGDDDAASAKVAKAEATTAAEPARQGALVELKDTSFQPGDIKVKAGQTIRFENEDAIAHTVTAVKGAKFDSGTLDGGKTFEFKPAKAGTISYVCELHPGMTGTITVD